MKIIVDTSIWIEALRTGGRKDFLIVEELKDLVRDHRAVMLGVIRQEILSGIREVEDFRTLQDYLKSFNDIHPETEDFEKAAVFHNLCWSKGITGNSTHFLIAAVAYRLQCPIFTRDDTFKRLDLALPIDLYHV